MDAGFLVGQIFNGFSVASIYILAAMGLALSFGLMRVINMAHGEILMVGSYLAYLTILFVPGPLGIIVAMFVALIGAGLMGALLEVSLVSKLKARPLDTLLATWGRSEEHTSELQSLMRISYAVFCLKKKNNIL